MGLLDVIKGVGDKIMGKVEEVKTDFKEQQELLGWQTKFEDAKANYDAQLDLMDEREQIYLGTHKTDANVNNYSSPSGGRKLANNVRNIVYEFIETQVDNNNPLPTVKAKRQTNEWKAEMIEDSIKADLFDLEIQRVNDMQERTTPIQGESFFELYWDNSIMNHNTVGDIKLRLIHPKQIIPQAGVWNLTEMDYFFVISSVTPNYILRRYKVDVENEGEQLPQANQIGDGGYIGNSPKVTEIACYYKDEDGDVGRFVWVNNVICENYHKFFYRRNEDGSIAETETIFADVVLKDGTIIPSGTEIPYFTPKTYPVVMRENVPIPFTFGGQSDVDVIRDQQDAIKKVFSKLEEKILKGGSIVALPSTQRGKAKLNDDELKVLYLDPSEANRIQIITMQPDISKDLTFVSEQYRVAQSTLGITDSFQGKPDPTARSGVAKQLQIAQATGRIKSKLANKYQAYKELFQLMFEFKLAFMDEPRPYTSKDKNGKASYGEFNRYEFLAMDTSDGSWYYDTDYMFSADNSGGLPDDRAYILEQTKEFYSKGAMDKIQLWQILESLHYPMASDIRTQIEEQLKQQKPQPEKPNVSISYRDLPVDAQAQLLAQVGIKSQGGLNEQQIELQKASQEAKGNGDNNDNSDNSPKGNSVDDLWMGLSEDEKHHILDSVMQGGGVNNG